MNLCLPFHSLTSSAFYCSREHVQLGKVVHVIGPCLANAVIFGKATRHLVTVADAWAGQSVLVEWQVRQFSTPAFSYTKRMIITWKGILKCTFLMFSDFPSYTGVFFIRNTFKMSSRLRMPAQKIRNLLRNHLGWDETQFGKCLLNKLHKLRSKNISFICLCTLSHIMEKQTLLTWTLTST